ncbi:hypothetical protein Tco_1302393 [Tanacetum coccineum]
MGKRIAKRATVDLDEDDEEKDEIGADRNEDSFWRHILQDFNNSTIHGSRTKNMLTGKLTRINGDCQKFNAIYKHLERKSGENEADHIETAKINFAAQQAKGRKFLLDHAWRILKNHSKWDAPELLDTDDHTKIFGPDVRPRPADKTRPAKKTKSETTESNGRSASGSISNSLSEDLRRKLQATSSAYEAKKEKELAYTECKELEFLKIDPDSLPEPNKHYLKETRKDNGKI